MAGPKSKEGTDIFVAAEQQKATETDYMADLNKKLETFGTMGEVGKGLAKNLLAREQTSYQYIIATYGKTKKGALALLENDKNVNYLEDFPENSLDQDVVDAIVKTDTYVESIIVLKHPALFKKPIKINQVLDKIIENEQGDLITNYFGNLKSFIDSRESDSDQWYKHLILKIFEKSKKIGAGHLWFTARRVSENINNIDCLSAKSGVDIGNWLAYNGCGDIIFEYFDVYSKFYEDAHKDMADSLIRWGGGLSVAKNIGLFNGWTIEKLMNELINQHQESIILENPEVFGLEKE